MYTCSCQCASCTACAGSSAPSTGDVESSTMESFLAEIQMLKRVSRGGCPHVVNLVAASSFADPVLMVMELAPYGSLLDYLRRSRQHVSMQCSYMGWDMHISAAWALLWSTRTLVTLTMHACMHQQFQLARCELFALAVCAGRTLLQCAEPWGDVGHCHSNSKGNGE